MNAIPVSVASTKTHIVDLIARSQYSQKIGYNHGSKILDQPQRVVNRSMNIAAGNRIANPK